MKKIFKTMDGNEAAAYVSYVFTEVASIYPITPSSPMAEHVDMWSAGGKKNAFGQPVKLVEMQSEAGAVGAMHGVLETGSLATTYTASQGLLLMVPTLFRLSGQLWPAVIHVSARAVGTHAFSIFGEHSDVMACRHTGMAMLASSSVQEVMDLAGVAHGSAISGSVPFIHFFDGFRTSHEIQKIEVIPEEELASLIDYESLERFRKRSLNPERPVQRSAVNNPDVYFQMREASNPFYEAIPDVVEDYMRKIQAMTGREYHLFGYYGHPQAEHVIVAMGSSIGVIKGVVDALNKAGRRVGVVSVHLYRPFSMTHFMKALPMTVKRVSVLDRTKEPGALGEPLYLDVCGAIHESGRPIEVYGGRYGLSIKDFTEAQVLAVYDHMQQPRPKHHFTVGIDDDVTHLSLPVTKDFQVAQSGLVCCKFWGLGSDGTVGANKNSIKIIGDTTDFYVQAYFEYDTKKSGGLTRSHLRFGKEPIKRSNLVTSADFVACHNQAYLYTYDILKELKPQGTFLLNTTWTEAELAEKLPTAVKSYLAEHAIRFYTINATDIALQLGLGNKANAILQAAFFKLIGIIPIDEAVEHMKKAIYKTYHDKGDDVVEQNYRAIDAGVAHVHEIKIPQEWHDMSLNTSSNQLQVKQDSNLILQQDRRPAYIKKIVDPINHLKGDDLPVSTFRGYEDGSNPLGTSQYEKRGVAISVPKWDAEKCVQCNRCSLMCAHAAIRPFLLNDGEVKRAPNTMTTVAAKGMKTEHRYRLQVSPLDCQGCGVCVEMCPAKALSMQRLPTQLEEATHWEYAMTLSKKENPLSKFTVKGSQFERPLLEFSGACAGCGETPYMKLLTQLYGHRLVVANATGCTQAWGAATPCFPYTTNEKGQGPAWSNSLFENNAEFGLGMYLSLTKQRERLLAVAERLATLVDDMDVKEAVAHYAEHMSDGDASEKAVEQLIESLKHKMYVDEPQALQRHILQHREFLSKKSLWMYGGDGWAYDIGYGGLDHVLASGVDINILLVDTEVYSNTGGQSSKATPLGAVAQFAYAGKQVPKKDLGLLAMSYGYVYVAKVALGADPNQLIKALKEAETYPGPSIVIAYATCINHGLRSGMCHAQDEQKLAVDTGYWQLYRYDPRLRESGKAFTLDSKTPSKPLEEFLAREVRFTSLYNHFPKEAARLSHEAAHLCEEQYHHLEDMAYKKTS